MSRVEPGIATTEQSPLLPTTEQSPDVRISRTLNSVAKHLKDRTTFYLCLLFVTQVSFPIFMSQAAKIRVLELGLCREHYRAVDPGVIGPHGFVPEQLCKVQEVQSALASLRATLSMLEMIPGLILAVPFGLLADRWGRKWVVVMNLLGTVLMETSVFLMALFYRTFPTRAILAAPACLLLGGGTTIMNATMLAIVASATPDGLRTHAFLCMNVALFLAEILAPLCGSLLMQRLNPPFAFLVAIPLEALGLITASFLNEQASDPKDNNEHAEHQPRIPHDEQGDSNNYGGAVCPLADQAGQQEDTELKRNWRQSMAEALSEMSITSSRSLVLVGIGSAAVQKLSRPIMDVILQYVSAAFGWPLSSVNFLQSIKAAPQLPLMIAFLPVAYRYLLGTTDSSASANLWLARASILCRSAGCVTMGCAPNASSFIVGMIVWTLGAGYGSVLRSFLASYVPKQHLATLYTAISVFESIVLILSTPLLGLAFSTGIRLGGLAMALPFHITAAIYGIGGIGVWVVLAT